MNKLGLFKKVFILIIFSSLMVGAVSAQSTRREYYITGDDASYSFWDKYWESQTFTVGSKGHDIESVKLRVYRTGNPGIVTVGIRIVNGNNFPIGYDLTNGTVNANIKFYTWYSWIEISLTRYTLLANTKYAIVVRAINAPNVTNSIGWRYDSSNPTYTGGEEAYSENSGGSWVVRPTLDRMFEVWGSNTPTAVTGIINNFSAFLPILGLTLAIVFVIMFFSIGNTQTVSSGMKTVVAILFAVIALGVAIIAMFIMNNML